MTHIEQLTRRDVLKGTAGLTLAFYLGPTHSMSADTATNQRAAFAPNAFVRIGTDNIVTVIAKHAEIGQGIHTGIATLIAEELDASWSQIRVESAPADASRYSNGWVPGVQMTGGSISMASAYQQMREAGAAARQMLVSAAAKRWSAQESDISVRDGVVSHVASNRRLSFGELSAAAALEPVPAKVTLKQPADFRFIGKRNLSRTDAKEKSNGSALFGMDIKLPGMVTALVAYPPRIGATVRKFDASKAKEIAGVVDVVAIPAGVAVIGKDFWSAKKGRDALLIEWDDSNAFKSGTSQIVEEYRKLLAQPGILAREQGNSAKALQGATKTLEAVFELPYLAHATMEPMDCVVRMGAGSCELWNGEQVHSLDQADISKVLGIDPNRVTIHGLYAGGSFGRRYTGKADYVIDAVLIAKALGGGNPVKLVRTREDDMRAGFYRPLYLHRLLGALDEKGNPIAWQHRVVGQSVVAGTYFDYYVKNGVDGSTLEGAMTMPYAIPNLTVDLHTTHLPVTVNSMRSVGCFHNAFAVESFMDELAYAAGRDPLELRRTLLKDQPRFLKVLNLAADKADWSRPLRSKQTNERRGRGIAIHEWQKGTIVAQVAEVTVQRDGNFKVDRVVCAVDCGLVVNPDIVRDQLQGGIGFGLSAALLGAITIKDGAVEQGNFDDYPVLRINQMPAVEVHIVPSVAPPTGIGEPGVPPIAPAVGNALFAATGKRLRTQPFETAQLKHA